MKSKISNYPIASFRELLSLTYPLFLSLISSYLLFLVDRIFLSQYSLEAFEACTAASGLYFFFQIVTLRFVSTSQAFISEACGSQCFEKAGSYTWQMIWFSLFSIILIIPAGTLLSQYLFQDSPVKDCAVLYFLFLIGGHVFLAIEGSLLSFFVGIGNTKKILKIQLISHGINLLLNFILIFGVSSIILLCAVP